MGKTFRRDDFRNPKKDKFSKKNKKGKPIRRYEDALMDEIKDKRYDMDEEQF